MTVPLRNKGVSIFVSMALFATLTTISTALRCYSRLRISRSFGADDIYALIAWVFFSIYCSLGIAGLLHGVGQHAHDIPRADFQEAVKLFWFNESVYCISNFFLKLAIALMLLRIAVSKVHKYIIWFTIGLMELASIVYFLLFLNQCHPASFFWSRISGATNGSCLDPDVIIDATYVFSAITCLVDFTFATIPIFIIWNLQMSTQRKLSVAVVLACGALASAATVLRMPYVKGFRNAADFTYATSEVAIWSTVETGIALTASSAATLRPLFLRRGRFQTSSSNTKNNAWSASGLRNKGTGLGNATNGGEVGVTTLIGANVDLENGERKYSELLTSGKRYDGVMLKEISTGETHTL